MRPARRARARRLHRGADARVGSEGVEGGGGGHELQRRRGLDVAARRCARRARARAEAAHLDAPERLREARRVHDGVERRAGGALSAARARGRPPRPASAARPRRAAARHAASAARTRWPPPAAPRRRARRPPRPRPGGGDRRVHASAPPARRAGVSRPPGATRLTPISESGTTGTSAARARANCPRLKGCDARRRGCACPPGKTTRLAPPRMRSAARCRLLRARKAFSRSMPMWPAGVEVEAQDRDEVQRALVDDAEVHGQVARTGSGCRARSRGWRRRRPAPPGSAARRRPSPRLPSVHRSGAAPEAGERRASRAADAFRTGSRARPEATVDTAISGRARTARSIKLLGLGTGGPARRERRAAGLERPRPSPCRRPGARAGRGQRPGLAGGGIGAIGRRAARRRGARSRAAPARAGRGRCAGRADRPTRLSRPRLLEDGWPPASGRRSSCPPSSAARW